MDRRCLRVNLSTARADHKPLHSFPTRRSSDLAPTRLAMPTAPRTEPDVPVVAHRSEEHTSELQSRENLVCRLLLEKKKRGPPNYSFPEILTYLTGES